MLLQEFLDNAVKNFNIKELFSKYEITDKNKEETRLTRELFEGFQQEFGIQFVERPLEHYYNIYPNDRVVEGLYPLSLKELLVVFFYCVGILYNTPKLSLAIDFVTRLCANYNIEEKYVEQVVFDLSDSEFKQQTWNIPAIEEYWDA